MRPLASARSHALVFALAALLSGTSCSENRAVKEIDGPPDLVKRGKLDGRRRSYPLRAFQVNHVWAGNGYEPDGADYRAKVTVWASEKLEGTIVAEIYFHEPGHLEGHPNPDPDKEPNRPWQLHFPVSAMGPILQALRNANEPVYLYYYDNQWAVGIAGAEAVGVD